MNPARFASHHRVVHAGFTPLCHYAPRGAPKACLKDEEEEAAGRKAEGGGGQGGAQEGVSAAGGGRRLAGAGEPRDGGPGGAAGDVASESSTRLRFGCFGSEE